MTHRPDPQFLSTIVRGCLGLVLGIAFATTLPAQQSPRRELPQPMEFLGSQDDNLFSLSRSQEDIHEWEEGLAELARGQNAAAVERLHKLLRTEIGGVVPVAPGRFLGLRLAVVTTLANLSPAAAEAYETLVQREAGNLAERPLEQLDADQLTLLAQRFPIAKIGMAARRRLGDLALEAGQGLQAANQYRSAIDATAIGSAAERELSERMLCAGVLSRPRTARARQEARRLAPAGVEVLSILPLSADSTTYSAFGGGEDGCTPMSEPVGRAAPAWSEDIAAPGFDMMSDNRYDPQPDRGMYAMFPVGDLDGLYVNTGQEVVAFDPLRRSIAWVSPSPMREGGMTRSSLREYDQSINPDMVLAAACSEDVVVAALQVPEKSINVDFTNGLRIISKMPQRRLFAYSRSTGRQLWSHFDSIEGSRTRQFRGHDACGPPLIVGDTVYAPMHDRSGAIAFSVGAYDLHTGALKWRRLVCSSQQEVNMFGNARSEFAASPLAVADGVLYGAANLGVVYALDVATGRVRWITAHDVVRMPMTRIHAQQERPVYFANNAPVVIDGVACFTPLDSQYVLGIETETGRILWRVAADAPVDGTENNVRWLAGAIDDEFLLVGRGAVAVKARSQGALSTLGEVRQLVRPEVLRTRRDGLGGGRPAVTADHLWLPTGNAILGFDRAGNPNANDQQIRASSLVPGNLLFTDGIVVSLRQHALDVLSDSAAVQARIETRLSNAPDDPAAILRLAALRAALLPADAPPAARQSITELYQRGLAASIRRGLPKSHPVRQALQRELFDQAFAVAKEALDRGDPTAAQHLVEARETAPDQHAWLQVQRRLIEMLAANPTRQREELDRLEREAGAATMEFGSGGAAVAVRAYVAYFRAMLRDQTPAAAVAQWQQLLELYPEAEFDHTAVTVLAPNAIEVLMRRSGAEIYAPIAARADAALTAAGNDPEALRAVSSRFPNSTAAATARMRLLDSSVQAGDLTIACEVLSHDLRSGSPKPGVLRRVAIAALVRGNRALAEAMADRLVAGHADAVSDWPDDKGATYAAVVAAMRPQLTSPTAPSPLQVPSRVLALVQPSPREQLHVPTLVYGDGFTAPVDRPLYAQSSSENKSELMAIDLQAPGIRKPVLFTLPVKLIDHVVLCGTTLIVPDLETLIAVDYRSGQLRWELPMSSDRRLDGLGVQSGVLHISAQSDDPAGGAEFLGIEPVSGSVLFTRTLTGERVRPVPKAAAGQRIAMQTNGAGDAELMRMDPVTGETLTTIKVAANALRNLTDIRPDSLAERVYPQGLAADAERIYLPIDSTFAGDSPRLLAIDNKGAVAWSWQGLPNCGLLMMAMRGNRIVVVEGNSDSPGRISLLAAKDGSVLRATDLGIDIDVLNWRRIYLPNDAPAAVLLTDFVTAGGRERRLICFGVDDDKPSFLEPLASEDGEVERSPLFGSDFLTYGVRPAQRGPFRLYAISLADRKGRMPGGAKSVRPGPRGTFMMTSVGQYTVISSTEGLWVLGGEERK